jgi:hypothetical protein
MDGSQTNQDSFAQFGIVESYSKRGIKLRRGTDVVIITNKGDPLSLVLVHPETAKPFPSDHGAGWVLHFADFEALESFMAERAEELGLGKHRPFHLLSDYWDLPA